ncbi:DsbA family protein [Candidatus Saccharibacteria bacterium]|nr:DsbA family protein [Candidatus Saccharibacteria bacterium]
MNKVTVVAIVVILALLGGLIAWSSISNQQPPVDFSEYDTAKLIKGDDKNGGIDDHVRGNTDDPKVIVVEYADLQCPGCAATMPRIHMLFEKYGDRVAFVYRNFPITGHQNARAAAAAAESAGFQGKYWEMVETIYANRAEWISEVGDKRTQVFVDLFKDIAPEGDVDKFRSDMSNPNIEKKVNFDYNIGRNVDKVDATPAFYVNGKVVDIKEAEDANGLADLVENDIKAALKEAGLSTDPVLEVTE